MTVGPQRTCQPRRVPANHLEVHTLWTCTLVPGCGACSTIARPALRPTKMLTWYTPPLPVKNMKSPGRIRALLMRCMKRLCADDVRGTFVNPARWVEKYTSPEQSK